MVFAGIWAIAGGTLTGCGGGGGDSGSSSSGSTSSTSTLIFSSDRPDIPTGSVPLDAVPGDYGLWPRNEDRVWTVGANLYATPHVVLKLDYQHFMINSGFTRFDLGLGLNF